MDTNFEYQPGLDGLRAVAIALVLVFHSGLGWLPGGFLGVSVFFTLSGYLITSILLAEATGTRRIDLGRFWERRFRRLLPAALVTITAVSLLAHWLSTPTEQARVRGDALASIAYVSNWRSIVSHLSYQDIFSTVSPLVHLWSLSIEEQMYLVLPLVVAGSWILGLGRRGVGIAALLLVIASTTISAFLVAGDRLYYGTDARSAELLIGVAAAALVGDRIPSLRAGSARAVSWMGCGALVALVAISRVTTSDSSWVYAGLLPVFALVSVVCVMSSLVPGPVRWLLSRAPLVRMGKLSYGAYLYHWPVFTWVNQERMGFGGVGLFALRLAVTAVATVLSSIAFERPIRERRILASRRSFFTAAGSAMIVAAVVPIVALSSVDTRPRIEAQVLSTVAIGSQGAATGPDERPLRLLVVGDSTAENIARALVDAGDESIGVVSAGVLGCPMVRVAKVFDRPRSFQDASYCPDNIEIVQRYVAEVDAIFVVGGVSNQWSYERADGTSTTVVPGSVNYRDDFDEFMNRLQETVAPFGVPIVVMDNPVTRTDDNVYGDESDVHQAWRAEIESWSSTWQTVVRLGIDDRLADPNSEAGRAQRPDGVHLERTFAADLARDTIIVRLRALLGPLADVLSRSGCRVSMGERAHFDLDACRNR